MIFDNLAISHDLEYLPANLKKLDIGNIDNRQIIDFQK